MEEFSRRKFILASGGVVGATTLLSETPYALMAGSQSLRANRLEQALSGGPPLYNKDVRTAIGLGDELASIVDRSGQVRSRRAEVSLELGSTAVANAESSQSLKGGYLPIVQTDLRSSGSDLSWVAFASAYGGEKCDYVGVTSAQGAYQITLSFPFATSLNVDDGVVRSHNELLAVFPKPDRVAVSQAKYNCVTPEILSVAVPGESQLKAGIDAAFGAGRTGGQGGHPLDYHFPVSKDQTYHVFLGMFPFDADSYRVLQRLSVNGESQVADLSFAATREPILLHFATKPKDGAIDVRCEPDPSTLDTYARFQLNGIWIFDHPEETKDVLAGKLNAGAVFYVPCGNEPLQDIRSMVVLDYGPLDKSQPARWIRLPYNSDAAQAQKVLALSPDSALADVKQRWDALLTEGAEFFTGDEKLDNLYKTSLINIFLLREKYAGAGSDGGDLYVVKPGATCYNNFWYRDGSYIITALGVAGHAEESEKSLRFFWQSGLKGMFSFWGQQEDGVWQAPITEWDGQGQALWALVNHYEFTRDKKWLRTVYSSIRKGALWIKTATEQTKTKGIFGEKPVYYGLLPKGEGEGVANGGGDFFTCHDFWAFIGLRQAMLAAAALGESDDLAWMKSTCEEFHTNLMDSLRTTFERVANRQFIAATPYNSTLRKWGAFWALYPCRVLDPHDPMITSTLSYAENDSLEDIYHFNPGFVEGEVMVWPYITADWAMCHLLRDEVKEFHRLVNGIVAHAAPTNVWVEIIEIKLHVGSGDMPHGWAAAQYVLLHRNALVYENQTDLELCWGVQPKWLGDDARIAVKKAPTKFGELDFELKRSGSSLLLDYQLRPKPGHPTAQQLRFHIPRLEEKITSIVVNGKARPLLPEESSIRLEGA